MGGFDYRDKSTNKLVPKFSEAER